MLQKHHINTKQPIFKTSKKVLDSRIRLIFELPTKNTISISIYLFFLHLLFSFFLDSGKYQKWRVQCQLFYWVVLCSFAWDQKQGTVSITLIQIYVYFLTFIKSRSYWNLLYYQIFSRTSRGGTSNKCWGKKSGCMWRRLRNMRSVWGILRNKLLRQKPLFKDLWNLQ